MEQKTYRKLNVKLPVEPIRNSQPWLVMGVLFALAILALIVFLYLSRNNANAIPQVNKRLDYKSVITVADVGVLLSNKEMKTYSNFQLQD